MFVFAEDVVGWYYEPEIKMLYEAALLAPKDGVFLELGCHAGRSTVTLSNATKQEVHAVDAYEYPYHPAKGLFAQTKEKYGLSNVVWHVCRFESLRLRFPNIAFLHIDGMHDYESVKRDCEMFFPEVVRGGIIVFHDSHASVFQVRDYLGKEFSKRDDVEFVMDETTELGVSVWRKK
jgi:hypothetical protein